MKINIDKLEKIAILLFAQLKENRGNEIELSSDFYWAISDNEIYNPYEEPKDISLGQLSDDWKEIQRLLEADDAIPYDLKRLSELIKALSIENKIAF